MIELLQRFPRKATLGIEMQFIDRPVALTTIWYSLAFLTAIGTQSKMIDLNDFQKIGIGLALFGLSFLLLGVLLLFDKGLLAIGNILFLSGLTFIIGFQRTFFFFFQKHKWKASTAFFAGFLIVFMGYPLIGMAIETYGFILLFRGFIPVAVSFLRRVPLLGTVLNLPFINKIADKLGGDAHRSMV